MRTYEDAGGDLVVAGYDTDPSGDRTPDVPLSSSDRTNLIANNNTVPLEEDLYTKDGQVQSRVVHGTNPIPTQTSQKFTWGYNQRLLRLDDNPSFNVFDSICNVLPQSGGGFIYPQTMARPEQGDGQLVWGYTYSPSGERESKRLLRAAAHDSACKVFPYIYYSQGVSDKTIVVYHGRQRFGPICGQDSSIFSPRHAAFYPVEFRAYGATGAEIVWEADAAGVLQPRFVDTDYQGSERLVRNANGTGPTITRDYFAFGLPTDNVVADGRRVGYLSKEVDWESFLNDEHRHGALSDLSARKYQPSKGAFVTQDQLWMLGSQYGAAHYSRHDPVNLSDPSGYDSDPLNNPLESKSKRKNPIPQYIRRREPNASECRTYVLPVVESYGLLNGPYFAAFPAETPTSPPLSNVDNAQPQIQHANVGVAPTVAVTLLDALIATIIVHITVEHFIKEDHHGFKYIHLTPGRPSESPLGQATVPPSVEQPVANANPGPSIPVQLPDGSLIIRPDAGSAGFGSLVNPGSLVTPSDQPLVMPPNSMSLSITNAAELIQAATGWQPITTADRQGFLTGNGPAIFAEITKGGQPLPGSGNRVLMPDGTEVGWHISSKGAYTIRVTKNGKTDKVRIKP